ncbi:MAG TPA: sulfatase-like hydrolase/transferase [Egibacteraceae bacterium]|nr:sulfatase-like hydrolase/transferase [Egibacteraceae bacterium]
MTERRRRRWLSWHPLAFAAWPVLNLWQHNIGHTPPREALTAIALVVGVAAVLTAALALVLRDVRRGALVASVVVLAVMLWGPVRDGLGETGVVLVAWLLLAAALAFAAWRVRSALAEVTTVAAGMAAAVVVLAVIPILVHKAPDIAAWRTPVQPQENFDEQVGEWSAQGPPRDIYYLVFDRYGSQESMERRWDFDLSDFFDDLQQRGFVVTPDSKANHLRTAQSLSSTFNLRYHHDLARRYGPNTPNMLPIYALLQDHVVGRLLQDRGYTYVHIGNWWDPTQDVRIADVNYTYERWRDFELELFRSTLLSLFERQATGMTLVEQRRRVPHDGALAQFRWIREAADRSEPTFTFAHVLLPHEPFVFDREGNYISRDEEGRRGRERNYREQTEYTNHLIRGLLDDLLDRPEDEHPIVVISADEGPHPVRFKEDEENFDWTQATDAELDEKMSILNAYYLPGAPQDPGLYPSISPVNTWRVLFNTYFGADLPLLEDRSYVFRNERHVYDFHEVTDRLR